MMIGGEVEVQLHYAVYGYVREGENVGRLCLVETDGHRKELFQWYERAPFLLVRNARVWQAYSSGRNLCIVKAVIDEGPEGRPVARSEVFLQTTRGWTISGAVRRVFQEGELAFIKSADSNKHLESRDRLISPRSARVDAVTWFFEPGREFEFLLNGKLDTKDVERQFLLISEHLGDKGFVSIVLTDAAVDATTAAGLGEPFDLGDLEVHLEEEFRRAARRGREEPVAEGREIGVELTPPTMRQWKNPVDTSAGSRVEGKPKSTMSEPDSRTASESYGFSSPHRNEHGVAELRRRYQSYQETVNNRLSSWPRKIQSLFLDSKFARVNRDIVATNSAVLRRLEWEDDREIIEMFRSFLIFHEAHVLDDLGLFQQRVRVLHQRYGTEVFALIQMYFYWLAANLRVSERYWTCMRIFGDELISRVMRVEVEAIRRTTLQDGELVET